jgi:RNA polymerase sigma-70 factor, ECF subfamily
VQVGALEVELSKAGASGVALSLGELYAEHAPAVLRWAARLGGPQIDAEDVLQEVFLKLQHELPTIRDPSRIHVWLFRCTANVVKHQRRKGRFRRYLTASSHNDLEAQGDVQAPPDDSVERMQKRERLYSLLDRMSERDRRVLVLFELEQRSGEEIAELLQARVETVWVWLHRARARFRTLYLKYGRGDP